MLTRSIQKKYCDKRWQELFRNFTGFIETKDAEAMHHLRVEIKKLQAFVSLLIACGHKHGYKSHFKPVRRIFKHGGLIREAHINLQLLEQYLIEDAAFKKQQEEILELQTRSFILNADKYRHDLEKVQEKLNEDLSDLENNCVTHLYKKQLQKIIHFFSTVFSEEELHRTRSRIKFLIYMDALMEKENIHHDESIRKTLDEIQHRIGLWHDAVLALELLKMHGKADPLIISNLEEELDTMTSFIKELSEELITGYIYNKNSSMK